MQPHVIHSASTPSCVQHTDHRIAFHQQSLYSVMTSAGPHSDAKVIEMLKQDLPLLCNDNVKAFPLFQPRINSTKT